MGELTSPWGELGAPAVFWPCGSRAVCMPPGQWFCHSRGSSLMPGEGTGTVVAAGSPAPRGQAAGVPCGLVLSQSQRTDTADPGLTGCGLGLPRALC